MIIIRAVLVAIVSFTILSAGYDWGLPSNERASVLFSENNELNNMVDLLAKNYRLQKEKTGNKIYIDNYTDYVKSMEYDESINMSLARFLMVPYAADDAFVLKAVKNLNPYEYDFDPNYYMYGGGLIYTSALALKIAEIVGYIKLKPDITYYLANPKMAGRLYEVLRLLVLIFSVIGIGITYVYVVKNHGQLPAILTTALVLINPESIASSHSIEPHMYVLPFFLLSLYYAYKYHKSEALTYDYIPAAIFAGLSIGTQASSMYIVVPIVITTLLAWRNAVDPYGSIKKLFVFFIIVAITVFLINPFYILNIEGFLQDLNVGIGNQVNVLSEDAQIIFKYAWAQYQISMFLLILFIIAIPYNLIMLRNKDTLFYLGIVIPAIVVYIVTGSIMQYIYPSLIVFSIIASLMLLDIYSRISRSKRKYFVIFVAMFIILSPGLRSFYYLINYKYDNRIEAGEWVNNNIAINSHIGITFPPTNYDSIPFRFHKYNLTDVSSIINDRRIPEYIIVVNRDIHIDIKDKYKLVNTFIPKSILGYRPVLKGEVAAIYAKTIKIYKKRIL